MDSLKPWGVILEPIHITIYLPPITKKNSQQLLKVNGRMIIAPSRHYKIFEYHAGEFLELYKFLNIDEPVNVKCVYYMPTRRRVDLVNLQEATLDVLTKYGVIKDDNCGIVMSMDGSRVFYDKKSPRTEIDITPV